MFSSWQILQCLTIQGLTSSGGSSVGGDGGSSSGVSRALVKDRWLTWTLPDAWVYSDRIFIDTLVMLSVDLAG